MTADRKSWYPLGHVGYLVMLSGYVAWAWTGEWRWGLTGVLAFLALAALNGHLRRRREQRLHDRRNTGGLRDHS